MLTKGIPGCRMVYSCIQSNWHNIPLDWGRRGAAAAALAVVSGNGRSTGGLSLFKKPPIQGDELHRITSDPLFTFVFPGDDRHSTFTAPQFLRPTCKGSHLSLLRPRVGDVVTDLYHINDPVPIHDDEVDLMTIPVLPVEYVIAVISPEELDIHEVFHQSTMVSRELRGYACYK